MSSNVRIVVGDDKTVLVDDEDVSLAVDALLGVVVGHGGIEAFGLVSADGLFHQEPSVVPM